MGFFQSLGRALGITGKPLEWAPGLLLAAGADPVGTKEAIERRLKAPVLAAITTAESEAMGALSNIRNEDVEEARDKLSLIIHKLASDATVAVNKVQL